MEDKTIRGITTYRENTVINKSGQLVWCRCGGELRAYWDDVFPVADALELQEKLICNRCLKVFTVTDIDITPIIVLIELEEQKDERD